MSLTCHHVADSSLQKNSGLQGLLVIAASGLYVPQCRCSGLVLTVSLPSYDDSLLCPSNTLMHEIQKHSIHER